MGHKRDPQFGFDPGWVYDYPRTIRMARAEKILWSWWRNLHENAYDELWYDCHIPRSPDNHPPGYSRRDPDNPDWRNMWEHLTVLRADVIARKNSAYTVIELRSQARESSFAQSLRYTELAKVHWPDLHWTSPILICDFVPPQINATGKYSAVTVYERAGKDMPAPPPAHNADTEIVAPAQA